MPCKSKHSKWYYITKSQGYKKERTKKRKAARKAKYSYRTFW